MRGRWLGLAAIVVALGAGAVSGAQSRPAAAEAPSGYVDVQFDTGVSIQSLNADGSSPTLAQQGFRTLAVPAGMTAEAFVAELRQRPDVLSAEPGLPVRAAQVPNDPYYDYDGINQAQYLTQIGAPTA